MEREKKAKEGAIGEKENIENEEKQDVLVIDVDAAEMAEWDRKKNEEGSSDKWCDDGNEEEEEMEKPKDGKNVTEKARKIEERMEKKKEGKKNKEKKNAKGGRKRKSEDRSGRELHKQGKRGNNNEEPNEDGEEKEEVEIVEERQETKVARRPGKYTRGRGHNGWRVRDGEEKHS